MPSCDVANSSYASVSAKHRVVGISSLCGIEARGLYDPTRRLGRSCFLARTRGAPFTKVNYIDAFAIRASNMRDDAPPTHEATCFAHCTLLLGGRVGANIPLIDLVPVMNQPPHFFLSSCGRSAPYRSDPASKGSFIVDDGAARHSCGPDIEKDRFVVVRLSATSWASVTSTVAVRSRALATS